MVDICQRLTLKWTSTKVGMTAEAAGSPKLPTILIKFGGTHFIWMQKIVHKIGV